MNKIIYKQDDLFKYIGNNTIFVHTVACRPKHDHSEISLRFKELFPTVYNDYLYTTQLYKRRQIVDGLVGKSFWFGYPDSKQRVAFLFVSKKFGDWQDVDKTIIRNFESALHMFLASVPESIEIHSKKLNVENFGIDWKTSESIINKVLQQYPRHKWYVHE